MKQQRRRLSKILVPDAKANNGSHLGGLAYALQQGLSGYQTNQDDEQYSAAQKALAEGLAPTTTPEAGEMGPIRPRGGRLSDALRSVTALEDNPYASELAVDLGMQQAQLNQQQEQLSEQRQYEDQRYNQRTADQRAFTAEQNALSRAASNQPPQERFGQPVQGVDAEGNPAFFQVGTGGSLRPVDGFAPPPPASLNKPLPSSAIKMVTENQEALATVQGLNQDLGGFKQMLDAGEMDLGFFSNLWNRALNNADMSTEESRNLAMFQSTLEKMRNDSLRLNNGVQTEGDAQRAWNELVANINDPEVVKDQLNRIMVINQRAADLRNLNIDTIYHNFGAQRPLNALNPGATGEVPPNSDDTPPPGVTPEEWAVMPPEDRALWK